MTLFWRVEMLGALRVRQGEQIIERFRTQKTGALLAYLAYYREHQHPREQLLELLWPEGDTEAGRHNLRMALSSLRHQLEPPGIPPGAVLLATRHQIGLNPSGVTTDVTEFEAALRAADTETDDLARIQHLTTALDLYSGELLPGCYEEWILPERSRLAEAQLQATRRLIRYLVKARQLPRALDYARRAVSAEPQREEAHRDLIRLFLASGQPSAALQQYRELEKILHNELSATPSAASRQLRVEIETALHSAGSATLPRPSVSPEPERTPVPHVTPPFGTVTFLMTDIVDSTATWERTGDRFKEALLLHHTLLRKQFQWHQGYEVKELGDGFIVAFEQVGAALDCALACQRALAEQEWPAEVGALNVRMALHTGDADLHKGDYHGLTLHRAARILSAAHGGQLLCGETTAAILHRNLPDAIRLRELGVYRLRGCTGTERLFQVEWAGMPQRIFPPPNAPLGYTGWLPTPITRFFGRETELRHLCDHLQAPATRLVTLTGPGGTGKTRLSLETGARLLEPFSGAVWFVALAEIADTRLLARTIADALQLPRQPHAEPLEQIIEALSRQKSLLILDNFEQLADTGAEFVQSLLSHVPTLTLLLTSRHTLNIAGEQVFGLSPLPTPTNEETPEQLIGNESVRLFLDRAQAVKPDFQITPHNARAIAELCSRLEGIPLALELAASRVQIAAPAQILSGLARRLDFLVSRQRDASARHRSLRATIEWGYNLLSPDLQRFFARLSLFSGGWTAEAAEAACAEVLALDYLSDLLERSLIVATETEFGTTRFQMLETLREFASEQLSEEECAATARRHLHYFCYLAQEAQERATGAEQADWFARLDTDHDNLRAALAWGLEQQPETALQLAASLRRFWYIRGYLTEARRWLEAALEKAPEADARSRALALMAVGGMARDQGDYARAIAAHSESLMLFRQCQEERYLPEALYNLALVHNDTGDYRRARELLTEGLALFRRMGNRQGLAAALSIQAMQALGRGLNRAAVRAAQEGLALYREVGNSWGVATMLHLLGSAERDSGDAAAAEIHLREGLELSRQIGNRRGETLALIGIGTMELMQGRFQEGYGLLEQGLALGEALGDPYSIAAALSGFGLGAYLEKDYSRARERLTDSAERARAQGDRAHLAWALSLLATISLAQGDRKDARQFAREALTLGQQIENPGHIVDAGGIAAEIAFAEGEIQAAARLLGMIEAEKRAAEEPLEPLFDRASLASHLRDALGGSAFDREFQYGQTLTEAEHIALLRRYL